MITPDRRLLSTKMRPAPAGARIESAAADPAASGRKAAAKPSQTDFNVWPSLAFLVRRYERAGPVVGTSRASESTTDRP